MRLKLLVGAILASTLSAFGQVTINSFDNMRPDTAFMFLKEGSSVIVATADTLDRVGGSGASLQMGITLASTHSWGTYAMIGEDYATPQDWSANDSLSFWMKVTKAPATPANIVFRVHLIDQAEVGGADEELIYEHPTLLDNVNTDWVNVKVPLVARPTTGVENPDTTGFIHAPTSWGMPANNSILDPDKIVGWRFVAVSTTIDADSLEVKFDNFQRIGHRAIPIVLFTGKDFMSYYSTWAWGASSITVVPGVSFDPKGNAIKWVQGDEWSNGWTGWGGDIAPPFDLGGAWMIDSVKFYMKCDTGTGAMRVQFESPNGKRGTVFQPIADTAWHFYSFPLRDMVVQDNAADFDSTNITVFGIMAEASGKVGKTIYLTNIWTGNPVIHDQPPSAPTDIQAFGASYVNSVSWTDTPGLTTGKYNVFFSEHPWTDAADSSVEDVPPYDIPAGTGFAQHVLRAAKTDQNVTYYYGVNVKDSWGNVSPATVMSTAVTSLAKGVPTISKVAPTSFVADGDLSEWAAITPIDLSKDQGTAHQATNTVITNDADLSVKAYIALDADNLYVAFDVTDDVVSVDTTGTDYLQDCPDLFIGLYDWRTKHHHGYTGGATPDYHLRFSLNRLRIDNDGGAIVLVPGVNYIWKQKDLLPGYTVEAKIPFTMLAAALPARHDVPFVWKEGMRIPIDFSINDNDTPGDNTAREGILCYSLLNNDNSWSDQFYWTYTWIGDVMNTAVPGQSGTTPLVYELQQNYPNPFNPSTMISYSLAKATPVTVKVYDVLGREIATLVNGQVQSAGAHQTMFNAGVYHGGLASGVYFYRIEAGSFHDVKKMMLVK
jgi:hypothetical protein